MDTIRIFISSPGDVADERERARQVVQGLQRRYARQFHLVPVLWEEMPLTLDMSFQQGIELALSRECGVDVAVFILWSRLGSPLGPRVPHPDGRAWRSGTERELHLMLEARRQQENRRPTILAYTRQDEGAFEEALRGKSTSEKEDLIRQKKLVEQFIREEFHDSEAGTNIRAYHSFSRPQSFAERLRIHLQEILDGLCNDRPALPGWDIDVQGPPFRGLEAFAFEHAEIFFGREDEVAEARARLGEAARRGTAFLLIGGASGTGKSSLAAAGLLPEIVANETDESVGRWLHAAFTPVVLAGDLAIGMARILARAVPTLGERGDQADFAEALARDPSLAVKLVLLPALKASATPGAGAVRLVLLVDQLEELFSDPRLGERERETFSDILRALATSGSVWVVATIRGDWYPRLLECPALVALKAAGAQLDLVPPEVDAVRRMIESPAVIAGLAYEKTGTTSLADRILRDVADRAELLPLLEDLLRELFERRTPGGLLTTASYESLGGIEGSLAKRAEASLASLPFDAQLALPEVLRRLVATDERADAAPVRRRTPLASFADGTVARVLVDRLVIDRLATASAGQDGNPEVAIAHEAIMRVWPRAASCIRENNDFFKVRDRLAARMKEGASLSAADPFLPAARALLETQRDSLEADLAAYVAGQIAAIDADRQRRERLRRRVVVALSSLAVATSLMAAAALWQWREAIGERLKADFARDAEREQRAAAEKESLNATKKLYVSNLFRLAAALEGPRRGTTGRFLEEALASYRDADPAKRSSPGATDHVEDSAAEVSREPLEIRMLRPSLDEAIAVFRGHDSSISSLLFSPDGTRVVTTSWDDTVRIWDLDAGTPMVELAAHRAGITGGLLSPDGSRLVIRGRDHAICLWDLETRQLLANIEGHQGEVHAIAMNADGTRVATASSDKTARVWDATNGELIATFRGHESHVTDVAFSPDGVRLATASTDRTARLWDAATGELIAVLQGHLGNVTDLAFSPDGRRLATASLNSFVQTTFQIKVGTISGTAEQLDVSGDHAARLWDATTGALVCVLEGHDAEVMTLAFSRNGAHLVTGSRDHSLRVWEAETGRHRTVLRGPAAPVRSVTFSPDGQRFAAVSDDVVWLWDAAAGSRMMPLRGHAGAIADVAFSPDGTRLATASSDHSTIVWDALKGDALFILRGHEAAVSHVAFSPDGRRVATAARDRTARLWDVSKKKSAAVLEGHEAEVAALALSPDGSRLATASDDGTVRLWDTRTCEELAVLAGHHKAVRTLVFNPSATQLASGSVDGTTRLWNATTGEPDGILEGHSGYITCLAYHPDGSQLATGSSDQTVRLWDTASAQMIAVLDGHSCHVACVAYNGDGSRLATAGRKTWIAAGPDAFVPIGNDFSIRIWDTDADESVAVLSGHEDSIETLAFSPDGRRLWSGSADKTVRLWDAESGGCLAVFEGHTETVTHIDYDHQMCLLVSASWDGTARLWKAANGEPLAVLRGHEDGVALALFTPDGRRVATFSEDRAIRLWDSSSGTLLATFVGHDGRVTDAGFGSDGSTLATASADGTARLWGLSNRSIHQSRIASAARRRGLEQHVQELFIGDGTTTMSLPERLDAAFGATSVADRREAANMLLLRHADRPPVPPCGDPECAAADADDDDTLDCEEFTELSQAYLDVFVSRWTAAGYVMGPSALPGSDGEYGTRTARERLEASIGDIFGTIELPDRRGDGLDPGDIGTARTALRDALIPLLELNNHGYLARIGVVVTEANLAREARVWMQINRDRLVAATRGRQRLWRVLDNSHSRETEGSDTPQRVHYLSYIYENAVKEEILRQAVVDANEIVIEALSR